MTQKELLKLKTGDIVRFKGELVIISWQSYIPFEKRQCTLISVKVFGDYMNLGMVTYPIKKIAKDIEKAYDDDEGQEQIRRGMWREFNRVRKEANRTFDKRLRGLGALWDFLKVW